MIRWAARVRCVAVTAAAVAMWAALVAAPALAGTGSYAPLDRPGRR